MTVPTPILPQLQRSRRLGKMNRVIMIGASVEQSELTSHWEALAQDYSQKLREAIYAELCSLKLIEIWEYILESSIARNVKIIGYKCVFKTR
jgi:hypothetical protein